MADSNAASPAGLTPANHQREKLVVVGNGMAGVRLLEELVQRSATDRYDITVFGSEPEPGYNRILLSPLLSGDKTLEQIRLRGIEWYAEHGIELKLNTAVTSIDTDAKQLSTPEGECISYDKLIMATGSNPFIIRMPGHTLDGVVSFRDLSDVDRMLTVSKTAKHAVVIGGGLLGLEAADGLLRRGMHVTVVHIADHVLDKQRDHEASSGLR